jgi:hypothetical protein
MAQIVTDVSGSCFIVSKITESPNSITALPITVTTTSKSCSVFYRSNAVILGSNRLYCDGLLKALRYGTRKPRVTRATTGLQLLSSEGLNNHDNRGTIGDIS